MSTRGGLAKSGIHWVDTPPRGEYDTVPLGVWVGACGRNGVFPFKHHIWAFGPVDYAEDRDFTLVNIVVCIPARYASTRFPGKVLAKDTGKYLIQHTYEQASKATLASQVIIAADDERIVAAAAEFGGRCVLTSPDHQSGTDRIAEVVADLDVDIVINVQGDEPEIDPQQIDYLARLLIENPEAPMATLATGLTDSDQIANPNVVKVVVGRAAPLAGRAGTYDLPARAIYFSRSPIPYDRDNNGLSDPSCYLRHLGIYAYRKDLLLAITKLPQTPLEKLEKLEQLRVIEHGYPILIGTVQHTCEGIDTPEQYAAFVERYRQQRLEGQE